MAKLGLPGIVVVISTALGIVVARLGNIYVAVPQIIGDKLGNI